MKFLIRVTVEGQELLALEVILGHACLHEFPGRDTFEVGGFVNG